jgi:hypothetical protein
VKAAVEWILARLGRRPSSVRRISRIAGHFTEFAGIKWESTTDAKTNPPSAFKVPAGRAIRLCGGDAEGSVDGEAVELPGGGPALGALNGAVVENNGTDTQLIMIVYSSFLTLSLWQIDLPEQSLMP